MAASKTKGKCETCGREMLVGALTVHKRTHEKEHPCAQCGKIVSGDKKFCDHSCRAIFCNSRREKKVRICGGCGVPISHGKYHSVQCQQDYLWRLRKEDIESTGKFPKSINNRVAKRYLLEKHGTICSICKNTMWMGKPIPLELDHVDGNWENGAIDNARMICGNCGMQLPTYKNRNKGNGRHSRRIRYKEGKSY